MAIGLGFYAFYPIAIIRYQNMIDSCSEKRGDASVPCSRVEFGRICQHILVRFDAIQTAVLHGGIKITALFHREIHSFSPINTRQ